jgi:hypothetical protein
MKIEHPINNNFIKIALTLFKSPGLHHGLRDLIEIVFGLSDDFILVQYEFMPHSNTVWCRYKTDVIRITTNDWGTQHKLFVNNKKIHIDGDLLTSEIIIRSCTRTA